MKLIVLVIASIIASSWIEIESDASVLSSVKHPFQKIRNVKQRRDNTHPKVAGSRLRVRSALPASVGSSNDNTNTDTSTTTADPTDSDFDSKCLVPRGPNFSKPPVLHFYSYKAHSDKATRVCGKNLEIELNTINGGISDNPELDTSKIKGQLIDSNVYDASAETYFIVHGFQSNWNSDPWMCNVKDLVLNNTKANVFLVNWSGGAKPELSIDYSASVSNCQYVGALLGEFIESLNQLTGQIDASHYHVIGHSLGAQISGFAGYYLNGTLGRITALDPAGPCFTAGAKTADTAVEDGFLDHGGRRVSRSSAQTVIALHTDAPLLGLKQSVGHYDVYVNGGRKQPNCGSNDIGTRIEDLFQLNFVDSFNLNIGCGHSYGHQLLNQFVTENDLVINKGQSAPTSNGNKCYPIAYECSSYKAFKAGECGFCLDTDTRCVYTGLNLNWYQLADAIDWGYSLDEDESGGDDDDEFNDENNDDKDGDQAKDPDQALIEKYSRGKHFMRSGPAPLTCVYQYQIVIATSKQAVSDLQDENKYYYYLHLPLELSGKLTDDKGNRLNDRLVQVSHKLRPNTTAYNYLTSTYLNVLPGRQDSQEELDFYTGLITFEPITQEDKCRDDPTNGAGRAKDKWQICSTLDNIQEARLWSSSETKLGAVAWVGMNYMSGLDYEQRLIESYVFNRIAGEPVKERSEVDKSNQAKLSETAPSKSMSIGNAVDGAKKTVDCLLSVFDHSDTHNAKRNFKCNRSGSELLYAVDLKPTKLATTQQ